MAAALAMAAPVTFAQGQPAGSIEERLQRLEAEQAAMKQQLAERDALIQELRRELQGAGATSAPAPVSGAAPAVAASAPVPAAAPGAPDAEAPA